MELLLIRSSTSYSSHTKKGGMVMEAKRHFSMSPLQPKKLIKANDLKEISNPIFFTKNNSPTSDGLLSNEIFGITKDERANTFAYIDLTESFLHPLHYKIWCKVDSKINMIVHGTKTFSIDSKGQFIEDEKGKTGIKFLKDNIDKIKFRSTDSSKRDRNIQFLMENRESMFVEQLVVIPAYYRDVNTDGGRVGVGDINKLYNSIIISIRALRESADYGLTMSASVRGRIQETIVDIYTWFTAEPNIFKKKGILKRAGLSKTTDYASRLVISAPNLKVESMEDLQVDLDHSAVPLASLCANLYPFMMLYIRRFFENEFSGNPFYEYIDKNGKIQKLKVKDYQIEFSDEKIKKQLDRFIHGFSNRFIPITIPNDEKKNVYMQFKGYNMKPEDLAKYPEGSVPLLNRDLTWCDVIFMAAIETSKDKLVLMTRYPIDSYYNQFPTKIVVASTKETEPMIYNNTFVKYYPKIRQEDIGKNTSNKFIDTLQICNAYLGSCGGDYDGDMLSAKVMFSTEANQELEAQLNSKAHYISLGGTNIMGVSNEGAQALYSLTKILPGTKLVDPVF